MSLDESRGGCKELVVFVDRRRAISGQKMLMENKESG